MKPLDYAAIEARILANTGKTVTDIYKQEAAKFYGVPEEAVTLDQRRKTKERMFSDVYGGLTVTGRFINRKGQGNDSSR